MYVFPLPVCCRKKISRHGEIKFLSTSILVGPSLPQKARFISTSAPPHTHAHIHAHIRAHIKIRGKLRASRRETWDKQGAKIYLSVRHQGAVISIKHLVDNMFSTNIVNVFQCCLLSEHMVKLEDSVLNISLYQCDFCLALVSLVSGMINYWGFSVVSGIRNRECDCEFE